MTILDSGLLFWATLYMQTYHFLRNQEKSFADDV